MAEKQGIVTISILGCGWLGLPLAVQLIAAGYKVKGTTTSAGKLSALRDAGIAPYLVQFKGDAHISGLTDLLDSDCLVILVPPGRSSTGGYQAYESMIAKLDNVVPESRVGKVVFASSTAVYHEDSGEVTESSRNFSDSPAARLMLKAEESISGLKQQTSIVRFAGLVGPERHPGRFFAGRKQIPAGLSKINLIHLEDAVCIIQKIIETEGSNGIWNAVSPEHPSRMEFYSLASGIAGFEVPEFVSEHGSSKIVSSERIGKIPFQFKYPSLIEWLNTDNV